MSIANDVATSIEGEEHEVKSSYDGSQGAKLQLAKTVASFANTNGGVLVLERITCRPQELDSARIDDLINKYVEPRIGSITVESDPDGSWRVRALRSAMRPHVMGSGETYTDEQGKPRAAFHEGQIYVRHSSKTQPARGDDVTRLINERVSSLLSSLGGAFRKMSLEVGASSSAIPVRIAMDAPVSISLGDINKTHPYIATTLGKAIGRSQSWVAAAAQKLGLKSETKSFQQNRGWRVEGA